MLCAGRHGGGSTLQYVVTNCFNLFGVFLFIYLCTARSNKTWVEGVQAAMTTRNLEPDQWRNREEWRLVFGRRRELLKKPG